MDGRSSAFFVIGSSRKRISGTRSRLVRLNTFMRPRPTRFRRVRALRGWLPVVTGGDRTMLNNYNCCMVADRMRLAQVNWETKSAVINDPLEWFWGSLKEAKLPTSGCHLFGQQTRRNRIKNIFFFSPVTKSACFAWNARTMLDLWDSGHFQTLDAWLSHTAVRASLEVCFCRSVGEQCRRQPNTRPLASRSDRRALPEPSMPHPEA